MVENKMDLYASPSAMEPLLPREQSPELRELADALIRRASELSGRLHPTTGATLAELLRLMNSYYSNLIEGHATHPVDIERALRREFAKEPSKRLLQLESVAHIHVQRRMEERLREEPELSAESPDFLRWIHREFYLQMPKEFLEVEGLDGKKHRVVPGDLRKIQVKVGQHFAPEASKLGAFLERFHTSYGAVRQDPILKILALAASHHRLAWIHPFLDGNGRVTRLYSQAGLIRCGLAGGGLWTLSRGLARQRDAYMAALAEADRPRQGDLDGRGNLSLKGLENFCRFVLETALDQVLFMTSTLELDGILGRIHAYVELESARGRLRSEARHLLTDAFLKGAFPRGEAARLTGLSDRAARDIVSDLLQRGLLMSDSPKGALRFGCPPGAVPYYFPRLYPEAVEVQLA